MSVVNLLIVGVAIILVLVVQKNLTQGLSQDPFVGKVPMVPIGGGWNPYYMQPGGYPIGQPMQYPQQYAQAKYPYYNDPMNQAGRPCQQGQASCGVLGACVNGMCTVKDQKDTVFDIKL